MLLGNGNWNSKASWRRTRTIMHRTSSHQPATAICTDCSLQFPPPHRRFKECGNLLCLPKQHELWRQKINYRKWEHFAPRRKEKWEIAQERLPSSSRRAVIPPADISVPLLPTTPKTHLLTPWQSSSSSWFLGFVFPGHFGNLFSIHMIACAGLLALHPHQDIWVHHFISDWLIASQASLQWADRTHNVIRRQGELGEILHQHTQFLGVYLVASCENTPHLLSSRHGSVELLLTVSVCLSSILLEKVRRMQLWMAILHMPTTQTISLQPFCGKHGGCCAITASRLGTETSWFLKRLPNSV